ncbi:MAG: glycosyltransferase family 2 protein [Maioricimonas sp. JB049]
MNGPTTAAEPGITYRDRRSDDVGLRPSHGEDGSSPYLSVVAPCYNEVDGLDAFYREVRQVCDSLGRTCEIVLVNDGSTDGTRERMQQLARSDPAVVAVNLSRNFGQERALAAGLSVCRGELVLILDADLQDPPDLLPRMLARIEDGADVVYGQRRSREGETWFKRSSAWLFYLLLNKVSETPVPRNTGPFRLMRRRVVDELLSLPEPHRFLRGLVSWIGFTQVPIEYDRQTRQAGTTHFPLRKMLALACDAVCSLSRLPLRLAGWFAIVAMLVMAAALLRCGYDWLAGATLNGWLAAVGLLSGLSGMQLLSLHILGEYVGRIAEQTRGRPLFIIESVVRQPAAAGVTAEGRR